MNSLRWCKFSKSGGFRRRGQKFHLGLFTTCRQASDHPGVQGLDLGENTEIKKTTNFELRKQKDNTRSV